MNNTMYSELIDYIIDAIDIKIYSIILYGSTARGENTSDSDIDIAVLVDGRLDEISEDRLSDAVVDMNLKYDKVFSVIDIDENQFEEYVNVVPFYRNVHSEGIVLWKAA